MSETVETAVRLIKIISTKGVPSIDVPYTGNTWGGLKRLLNSRTITTAKGETVDGYDLSSMKVLEGIRKGTLEHDEALLPEGDFKLYLLPLKTKAGAKAAALKKVAPAKKAVAKKAATKTAKKAVAKKAAPKKAATPATKVPAKKAKAISKVVESVKEAKATLPVQTETELQAELRSLAQGVPNVRVY